MAKSSIFIGLDVGTTKICVVVAETRSDSSFRILGVGQAPSRGVRKGEIVDFETVRKCVDEALADGEDKSDVEIRSIYLGITGGHIGSFNNRGCVMIPSERDEIEQADIEDVMMNAREVSIPAQNNFLHTIIQHFYVDGQDGVLNPLGMLGNKLEADFHIVHGISNRIKNTIRCAKEINLHVEDVVFNGLASAQVVLDQNEKDLGALVIDIGGGTTDYVVYADGAVKQSGVLAVGGDHVTNDISVGLRLPMAKAEQLKVEEGSVVLGNSLPGEAVVLRDDSGFAGREIERESLNVIMHMRLRETFELLKRKLSEEPYLDYLGAGAFITGGCSLVPGIDHLCEEIIGMPVQCVHAQPGSGVTSAFRNPQFSTGIGLVKYAQAAVQRPAETGLSRFTKGISRIFGSRRSA